VERQEIDDPHALCCEDAPGRSSRERGRRACAVLVVLLLGLLATTAAGQSLQQTLSAVADAGKSQQGATEAATGPMAPEPIPLAQVATESEALQPWLRQAEARLEPDLEIQSIEERLSGARDRLLVRVSEARLRLSQRTSIESLGEMKREWTGRAERIVRIRAQLTRRTKGLEALLAETEHRQARWEATLEVAPQSGAPADLVDSISGYESSLAALAARIRARRGVLLSLLDQVLRSESAVESLIAEIGQASADARGRLLDRDRLPVWSAAGDPAGSWRAIPASLKEELGSDWVALRDYFVEESTSPIGPLLVFVAALSLALAVRSHVQQRLAAGQKLEGTVEVFGRPIAVALLAACLTALYVFANAPALALNVLGLLSLIPLVRLLLPIISKSLHPALFAVAGCYVLDRVRPLFDQVVVVERGLLLLESVLVLSVAVALLRSSRWREILASASYGALARRGIQAVAVFLAIALVANIAGYMAFAQLLVEGILRTVVLGIIAYAIDRVITTALLIALSTSWARRSGIVRAAAPRIVELGDRGIRIVLAVLATLLVLRAFMIEETIITPLEALVFTPIEIGTLSISLSDLLVFGLTVASSVYLSRFVRFALKEEVFSRVHLHRGIPNAISATAGYVVLLGGFFIALMAAGIDLSRFTVLAGAFGVGIGFGLQNVVNNFVSGLILIYERPVQAGDTIQIGEVLGTINRIGIRSSTVRTFEGAEVIVPNANLISEQVVNWTLSDRERRIQIPVGVAYGSDHERVIEVLRAAMHDAPDVLASPEPEVLFHGLGDSSLDFECRFWTVQMWFLRVRSDVLGRIYTGLAEAGIEIPFPQRDLHLRSLDADAARSLPAAASRPSPDESDPSRT